MDISSMRLENTNSAGLDLVDWISPLPDEILSVILSKLPTKNAVATSILSKGWKFKWMTLTNLDFSFDDEDGDLHLDFLKFAQFVNRVLLLPGGGGGSLNKLHFVWETSFIPSQATLWINTAITRHVRELFLSFDVCSKWDLPLNLLSCETLQCLELIGGVSVSAPIVVSLPRLECLRLVYVRFESEETFKKLTSCSLLRDLYVEHLNIEDFTKHYSEDDVFKYRISSPFLRSLQLCDDQGDFELPRRLELEAASSLEYLLLYGPVNQVFVQGSLSSLVEANFQVNLTQHNEDSYNSLTKGVRSFHCAKVLILSHDVMWALGNATISLSTKFKRLTRLTAHVVCCYFSTLLDFIQSADHLKELVIYKIYDPRTDDPHRFNHDHSNWTVPSEVSKCLSNSLKKVAFGYYRGADDEREMIGYMLKHGGALEVMRINFPKCNWEVNKIELAKGIRMFPRKSPACKVEFRE